MAKSIQVSKSQSHRQNGYFSSLWEKLTDGDKPYSPIIRYSALAGGILLYIGLIGMIESFSEREVIRDIVTLGDLVLFAPALLCGLLATRKLRHSTGVVQAIIGAAIVGLLAAIPTILVLGLNTITDVGNMFINVNRNWIEIVTFDNRTELVKGSFYLLVGLSAAGLLGGVWNQIPDRLRKALVFGLAVMLTIGIMSDTVRLILQEIFTRDFLDNFFRRNTLLPRTAVALFIGSTIVYLLPRIYRRSIVFGLLTAIAIVGLRNLIQAIPGAPSLESTEGGTSDAMLYFVMPLVVATTARFYVESQGERQNNEEPGQTVIRMDYAIFLMILLVLPWLVGRALSDVLVQIGLFALMGLGLNIAIGLAGLLDLGYVTNYAVGAYIMAVLTSTGPLGIGPDFLSFWLVIPITLLAAMFAGFFFAVPVLKMRGDYLAIATLGFGEIIGRLALSDALKDRIGGAQGVLSIPKPPFFGTTLVDPEQLYYVILGACLITLLLSIRLNNSRTGRQWMAIREDEDAASAMGINVPMAKLLAFTISAATGGVAGAIFAAKVGTVFPNSFTVFISINVLSLIIVGGLGSNPGIIVGAIFLIGLPELLREFSDFRWLMYGIALIWMMINRPEGMIPSQTRKRELHGNGDNPTAPATAD